MMSQPLRRDRAALALACMLMIASGFAGLAYQIIWTQQSTAWLGHESAAVLAVVAAFFGGLALGALALGSRIERSARPARWYAGCEIVIGLWSCILVGVLQPISNGLLQLIGPQPAPLWHWSIAFLGTFLLLLPATAAMGATLPAMERTLAARFEKVSIGALYAANTFGAVIGVLAAAFWLVPQLGLTQTSLVCAVLNFACAAVAFRLQTEALPASSASSARASNKELSLLAATGLLGIGYEVLVVRALSQVAENTVYTFALLLAVYLIGTVIGAAMYARWFVTRRIESNRLLQLVAGACLLGTLLLVAAAPIKDGMIETLGASVSAALAAEATLAATAFLLPTIFMGALFSHLSTHVRDAGISFSRAIGVNTLGAAIAPFLFGVLLLPMLGLKFTLLLVVAGYLALTARSAWLQPIQWATAAAIAAAVIWMPTLQTAQAPEGGRLVAHIEGIMASVSVIEDASGVATLHINNRQQEGSSATLFADGRQALLPILLHPAPKRALFLGVGTGLTASSATIDPSLQVDAVELVPEVITATQQFVGSFSENSDQSRLHMMSADARRFVRTSDAYYDAIVSDNFHPARSGSASLYTVEHFQSVHDRLNRSGVFCQWLPLHQMDLDTLRSIVRSYLTVFPNGSAILATNSLDTPVVGLISHRDGEMFDLADVRNRVSAASTRDTFAITDALALLGSFIAGPSSLQTFAASAPLNTDDRPIVAYRAPNITYAPQSTPRDRLVELLSEITIEPTEILNQPTLADDFQVRLIAYWQARDRFIDVGRNVRPSSDVREMLAQVYEPLMSVLRISPDFEPAYQPLLRMGMALASVDRDAAVSLLNELNQVAPAWPETADALERLARAKQ